MAFEIKDLQPYLDRPGGLREFELAKLGLPSKDCGKVKKCEQHGEHNWQTMVRGHITHVHCYGVK